MNDQAVLTRFGPVSDERIGATPPLAMLFTLAFEVVPHAIAAESGRHGPNVAASYAFLPSLRWP
jgi:hypothetical protein